MRISKTSKGITLIALVITIIVLLILAGVSISMLTGENGILTKATEAKQKTEQAEKDEQVRLAVAAARDNSGNFDKAVLKKELDNYGLSYSEKDGNVIVETDNKKYIVNSDGEITEENKITTGETTTPTEPEETETEVSVEKTVLENAEAAKPSNAKITVTDASQGIVMVDSNYNEWVWVEVPASVFTTATSSTDYDKIKADLIKYAEDYRKGSSTQNFNWSDEWYDVLGTTYDGKSDYSQVTYITSSSKFNTAKKKYGTIYTDSNGQEEAESYVSGTTYYANIKNRISDTTVCGLTYNEYKTAYETMLSSVYTNKGFYISRYEIGDEESTTSNTTRTSSTGATNTPVSKVDQIPYNYVTRIQAQTLASKMKTGDKTSSLLFGIQWDLVCKFLEVKGNWDTSTNSASYYINENSTSWGNFKNSSLTLKSGKYLIEGSSSNVWKEFETDTTKYVTNKVTSDDENYYQLLTTGASEGTKKMNIYNFAGNAYEWTLETSSSSSESCVYRGGAYNTNGSGFPASQGEDVNVQFNNGYVAFRASLY